MAIRLLPVNLHPHMSNTVIGMVVIASGVLSALGAVPIRLRTRPVNRYWERRPTKYTRLSCTGGAVFFISAGSLIICYDVLPERYRVLFAGPAMLGLVVAIAAQALDKQSNRTPTIAFLTNPDEPARRTSVKGWIIAALGVLFLFLILSLCFRH